MAAKRTWPYGPHGHKKTQHMAGFLICGEKDLNLHGITSISPSS